MNGKRNPVADCAGVMTSRPGGAMLSGVSISRHAKVVKPRFDARLSSAVDRAVDGVESTTGIPLLIWRMHKAWLESQIPFGGGSKR